MTLRTRRDELRGRASLSPPIWKDQLKQRCMQRLRADRHELLAKLRSPDATRSVADEMQRLVYSEQQRDAGSSAARFVPHQQTPHSRPPLPPRHPVFALQQPDYDTDDTDADDIDMTGAAALATSNNSCNRHSSTSEAYASIEELVAAGQLAERDYLEIVHALEDELLAEMDTTTTAVEDAQLHELHEQQQQQQLAEQMVAFEAASLDAMLAALDLSVPDDFFDDEFDVVDAPTPAAKFETRPMLPCPVCHVGAVVEMVRENTFPRLVCSRACGFVHQTQHEPLHGAVQDLHEAIAAAFLAHREQCDAELQFSSVQVHGRDALAIACSACRTSELLPL